MQVMKFLNVFCENRKAGVYINLDKIILITKLDTANGSVIELDGDKEPVNLTMPVDELIRKINGEDKEAVGFRTSR